MASNVCRWHTANKARTLDFRLRWCHKAGAPEQVRGTGSSLNTKQTGAYRQVLTLHLSSISVLDAGRHDSAVFTPKAQQVQLPHLQCTCHNARGTAQHSIQSSPPKLTGSFKGAFICDWTRHSFLVRLFSIQGLGVLRRQASVCKIGCSVLQRLCRTQL